MRAAAAPAPPPTSGFIGLSVSTRLFNAPLFGTSGTTDFQISGRQLFPDGSEWNVSAIGGFPLVTPLGALEGDRIPFDGGLASATLGDFALAPQNDVAAANALQLIGGSLAWQRDASHFLGYAGRPKYPTILGTTQQQTSSDVAGFEYLRDRGANHAGGAFVALRNAITGTGATTRFFGRADFLRTVSPAASLFASAFMNDRGAPGFRAGARYVAFRGDVVAAAYTFDRNFTLLYPLLPAGEHGIDVAGSYRPSEFSLVYGDLNYASNRAVLGRTEFRGHLGYGFSLGTTGPYFDVAYHRDELTHDQLSLERENAFADRFVASVSRAAIGGWESLRLEHVIPRGQAVQTQLIGSYGRLLSAASTVDGNLIAQHERGSFGATAEASYERPVSWPYAAVIGGGIAFVDRHGASAGDGVIRIGATRRFVGRNSGWYARVEARVRVPVGLPTTGLSTNTFTFTVGDRIGWTDIAQVRSAFTAIASPSSFSSVEGVVAAGSTGIGNVPVLVDGVQRAVTNAAGRYRIARVAVGVVTVSIDTSALEQDFYPAGAASRQVLLTAGSPARVDFEIARFVGFAGSVVLCRGSEIVPVEAAKLALVGRDVVQTATTATLGAFEFDRVPPGRYDLVIDPESVKQIPPALLTRHTVDLTSDLLGYVVKIGCR